MMRIHAKMKSVASDRARRENENASDGYTWACLGRSEEGLSWRWVCDTELTRQKMIFM